MDGETSSRLVGVITLATGAALVAAPDRMGWLSGLDDRRTARLVGLGDLVLVPGLLAGRPRWPWMAARAAMNVPMAAVFLASPRRSGKATGLALLALTVDDVLTARGLRRDGR